MKALKILGWTMIWSGGLILAFLAYQLVGTNLITARAQRSAEAELAQRFAAVRATLDVPVIVDESTTTSTLGGGDPVEVAAAVLYEEPAPAQGEALGQIIIPKIDLDHVMMEGVERDTLKAGPGHMPWTPIPGQPGNAVISGHRTTYGAPFFDLDQLEPGDEIMIETALGVHVYAVTETLVVSPTDVWVTNPRPGAWLTLTTCNPRFSARERLIIVAELVEGPNLAYAREQLDEFLEPMS